MKRLSQEKHKTKQETTATISYVQKGKVTSVHQKKKKITKKETNNQNA
jgi:hypothetical protein